MKKQNKNNQVNNNFDITEFIFTRDNVLVKALRATGKNGLIDPNQYEDKPEFGIVISIGEEVNNIRVKDIVRFGKYTTESIRTNGEDYFIVREEDISAHLPR